MIKHIVLFAYGDNTTKNNIDEITRRFLALEKKIDLVCKIETGADISIEGLNHNFSQGFIVTFKTVADRDAYLPHPAHKDFSEFAGPFLKKVLVFDFEV